MTVRLELTAGQHITTVISTEQCQAVCCHVIHCVCCVCLCVELLSVRELIHRLPVQQLKLVLVKTIVKLVNDHSKSHYKTHNEAFAAAYNAMSLSKFVCYNWWQTMNGWPQSNTRHWLRHRLQHSVQSKSHTMLHIVYSSVYILTA